LSPVCLTKKYKYYHYQLKSILEDVWGETIKEMRIMLILAVLFAVPAIAQNTIGGSGGVDVLGKGIFETSGDGFQLSGTADTNLDSLQVGDDKATAFGMPGGWPWLSRNGPATATNNLEIKKNQDSGKCTCCQGRCDKVSPCDNVSPCRDCCIKLNLEQIKVGNRYAMAYGPASAANYIKIVTNQN
jgi:hypothetical protein